MSADDSSDDRQLKRQPVLTKRGFVILAGIFALLMILLAYSHNRDTVRFEGRLLADYFVDLVRPPGGGSYIAATNALFSLGNEAFPVVLRHVERPAPLHVQWYLKWRTKLPGAVQSYLFRTMDPYRQVNRHEGAIRAVGILGTNAIPIVEQLADAFGRVNPSDRTLLANGLVKLGPAVVPHLKRYLVDPDLGIRSAAVSIMGQLGSNAVDAVPELVQGIAGADGPLLRQVANALSMMGPGAAAEVERMLTSKSAPERFVALEILGRKTQHSNNEVLLLVKALDDPDLDVRLQAALIISSWWPVDPRNMGMTLFRGTQAFFNYNANSPPPEVQQRHDRWLQVLREGLDHPDFDKRLTSAVVLVGAQQADDDLVRYLDELKNSQSTSSFQRQAVSMVLDRAREQAINRRYGATNARNSRFILQPQPSIVR